MGSLQAKHDVSLGTGLRFQRIVARPHDDPIVRGYEVFGPHANAKGLNAQDYFLQLEKSRSSKAIVNHDLFTASALFATLRAQNLGTDDKFYALNISAVSLQQPSFADRLNESRERFGIAGKMIGIEITETGHVKPRGLASLVRNVEKLHGQNNVILIDDAPVGQSFETLAHHLKDKIGFVKLDKLVVQSIANDGLAGLDARTGKIVRNLRDRGQMMIAEGVETSQQANALQSHLPGVFFQGHFFGAPQSRLGQHRSNGGLEKNSVIAFDSRPD